MNLQDLQTNFQQKVLNADCISANWIKETTAGIYNRLDWYFPDSRYYFSTTIRHVVIMGIFFDSLCVRTTNL